ncbi:pentapeptide repeat-containing protein [Actinomycetospora sp. TBRC 11914]|uniref:pentapeptide repeat-containing protein n=1 Tax=Actinomycetospora sp. TBRC 11914 TaxID=2729387 RepID=UPI0020070F1F|nr:pentapeptide repeat-containing protein [Actinomycetospora sp. TBRC 11914]
MTGADLGGAILTAADLRGADLIGAVLYWADLTGADLLRAKGADLTEEQWAVVERRPDGTPGTREGGRPRPRRTP